MQAQFKGQMVLVGVDDMDLFKGIELKLQALERVLDHHAEWRGRLVLVQVTNPPRRAPSLCRSRHLPVQTVPACQCISRGSKMCLRA